jgi:hypothetical protein
MENADYGTVYARRRVEEEAGMNASDFLVQRLREWGVRRITCRRC